MFLFLLVTLLFTSQMSAAYVETQVPDDETMNTKQVDSVILAAKEPDSTAVLLSLHDAIKVALSENISVKVADKDIQRAKYAKKGTYAALYPNFDFSGSYQRTIKKQVMYMDADISGMSGAGGGGSGTTGYDMSKGIEVGRWNSWSAGITASMPIINAPLWETIKMSGDEVELAVEKARGSRLEMVSQVKNAYFAVLLAKEAARVYQSVYENAKVNFEVTKMKYLAQKASEMDYVRSQTVLANSIPEVYNSLNAIDLSLWRLKAVMGLNPDSDNIEVYETLGQYAEQMFYQMHSNEFLDLSGNSSLKQLDKQLEELGRAVKAKQYAYIPSLALGFNYSYMASDNTFNFNEYHWNPYSYVGLSLTIPIFSGHKRLNDVRVSKVQREELQLQRTEAERNLKIAVKADLNSMDTYLHSYYAAEQALISAKKGYEITSTSYRVGRSTLVELNDAMLALVNSELSQWQAVYNFLLAKTDLEQQLGQDYVEE